jgi:hypothetical protein
MQEQLPRRGDAELFKFTAPQAQQFNKWFSQRLRASAVKNL